jgi:hypothetical protein
LEGQIIGLEVVVVAEIDIGVYTGTPFKLFTIGHNSVFLLDGSKF